MMTEITGWVYSKNGKPHFTPSGKKLYVHSTKPTSQNLQNIRAHYGDKNIVISRVRIIIE